MSRHWFDHHPECAGGCGELADECRCPNPNPWGAFTITRPDPNPFHRDPIDEPGETA